MTADEGRFDDCWTDTYSGQTYALGAWKQSNSEVAAFVRLSDMWSSAGFEGRYREIGQRLAHDDSRDQIDLFYDELGIMPHDYAWILRSAAIKELVTAFEVYLDSVGTEMLAQQGYQWKIGNGLESVNWARMRDFYRDCLAVEVETVEVKKTRRLRNILTHQRGELRTDEQREEFGSEDYSTPADVAHLDSERISRATADLATVVHAVDKAVLACVVGSDRLRGLDQCGHVVPLGRGR
ncbi:hypothetical protein ACTD5D_40890 [Nocardia takedensis]|uniref:hypothetical protein n=1 Tax=Nocardia takedensis TaxID=259390 RepID=UPI003F777DC8